MFRKNLDPKVTAVVTLVVLGAVQYAYWRGLVYVEPGTPPAMGGPGGGGSAVASALGHEDVSVATIAGGEPGYVDGPGWQARFCGPNALAVDAEGRLFVADSRNHRIRQVSPQGTVSTVAGGGEPGGQGGRAEGPALEARLRFPSGVAVAPGGGLLIADTGNHRICKLVDGTVSVLAGGSEGKTDGRGTAARFRHPAALTFHGGALWVADIGNQMIRRVTLQGEVSTPSTVPLAVATGFGELIASRAASPEVMAAPDGRGSYQETRFKAGRQSPSINVGPFRLFADTEYHTLLAQSGGETWVVAGRYVERQKVFGSGDGPGNRANFAVPCAVAASPDGTVFVSDYEGHRIRRITLPEWLSGGGAPAERPQGAGRIWRGR